MYFTCASTDILSLTESVEICEEEEEDRWVDEWVGGCIDGWMSGWVGV